MKYLIIRKGGTMDEVNHYMDQILEIRHQSPEKERELA